MTTNPERQNTEPEQTTVPTFVIGCAPKESRVEMKPLASTFLVRNGLVYDYFTTRYGERKGNFVEILATPPVIKEGYASIDRKLYYVSTRDLLRRRVNVTTEYKTRKESALGVETSNAGTESEATTVVEGIAGIGTEAKPESVTTVITANQSRSGDFVGFEELKAANMAWEDQVRALLNTEDPEEEWEDPNFT